MKEIRKKGLKCLKLLLKNKKNIKIFENTIYKLSHKDPNKYIHITMGVCNDIENKKSLREILSNLKKNKVLFQHDNFTEFKNLLDEQDEFTVNPFEIEEGVLQCNKCDSKKTFSYTLQTRSGDEATTVFACCAQCGAKWKT